MIISHEVPTRYNNDNSEKGKRLLRLMTPMETNGEKTRNKAVHTNIILLAGNTGKRCHKRKKI